MNMTQLVPVVQFLRLQYIHQYGPKDMWPFEAGCLEIFEHRLTLAEMQPEEGVRWVWQKVMQARQDHIMLQTPDAYSTHIARL